MKQRESDLNHPERCSENQAKGNWTGAHLRLMRMWAENDGKGQPPHRSDVDMIAKQAIHFIPNAIAKVVADFPYPVQPGNQGSAVVCG